MKTVKIILGILIALSLVFFGTGLFVKETKYTAETVVNKSVKEVFKKFDDKKFLKEWMPEIKTIEPVNETPQKIGSTYNMVIESEDGKIEMKEKIIGYIPNKKITFRFTSNMMLKTDDYNFIDQGETTKLVQNSTIRSNTFLMACVFPWFKSRFEELSQENMQKFKEFLEK